MVNLTRYQILLIVLACVLAVFYALPNAVTSDTRAHLSSFLPARTVNLGLDLQGGSHLLLQADIDSVYHDRAQALSQSVRPALHKAKIDSGHVSEIANGTHVAFDNASDASAAHDVLGGLDSDFDLGRGQEANSFDLILNPLAIKRISDQTLDQSIEIVRRRIDETGTREPVIQRQGADRIIVELPGVSDPGHIKDLLGRTAKLTFNLVDIGKGVDGGTRNLPMQAEPQRMLPIGRRPMITGDMLVKAAASQDQYGQPDVTFSLNGIGTRRFCDVTTAHVGEPFAIVLDDKIVSAPNLNEAICGGSAQISGHFSVQESSDLALLLRAGALPAPLKVMEERTVGPTLGADSVAAGKKACIMALVFVTVFSCLVYGLFGVFASIALLVNMVAIIAIMSVLQATLTLPGIAGIVLAIGLAVDGNVLVFERIKEELRAGRSIISAIDTGYRRARVTIIDSNLTALISALILFSFGTGPIKGFAVTMCIGVVTSYFAAIMLTRLMVLSWLRWKKPKEIRV